MKSIIIVIPFMIILSSCSHSVHQVYLSDHNMKNVASSGKSISVQTEQKVFMGITFDTNFVEMAKNKLEEKCKNGHIRNIFTRYSTSHGFFHWKNKIFMEGLCFKK